MKRRTFIKGGLAATTLSGIPRGLAQDETLVPYFLVVYASGGWDPTMVFDPHLGEAIVANETGATVATGASDIPYVDHADRPAVKTWFDTYGANAAIVNGLYSQAIEYDAALANMYGGTPDGTNRLVDFATFYALYLNAIVEMPAVFIDSPYMPGAYAGYTVRLTQTMLEEYAAGTISGATALSESGEAALNNFYSTSYAGLTRELAPTGIDYAKAALFGTHRLRENFVKPRISSILETLGDQGTDSNFVRHGKIAAELFAADASQAVVIQAGDHNAWDTRSRHFARQSILFNDLFNGLTDIFAHAADLGVLDKMTVLVMSERGRSPQLNADDGKDPWPYTSAMCWGAGIQGGVVHGQTDGGLRGIPFNPSFGQPGGTEPLTMANIMAAIYLQNNVPGQLLIGQTPPLATLLATGEETE